MARITFDHLCPEAKLILVLAIMGCAAGVTAGETLITASAVSDKDRPVMSSLLGLFGVMGGLILGKVTGTVARACGWGYFWKEPNQKNLLDEEKLLNYSPEKETTNIFIANTLK